MISIGLGLQSCKKETENVTKDNPNHKKIEAEKIPSKFKSPLRPNENIVLGKIYTDTVNFVNFNDDGDDSQFIVEKNKDTIRLIYNNDDPKFLRGNELEIKWKMDSMRPAGDSEFLDYREFLVSAKKIKDNFSKRDFSKLKNRSFVISCGTGCAMTHNVKKIKQINPLSIEVTFEIDMYINEEHSETFDDTFIFKYNNSNKLEKITREGETENALETFVGSAKESFEEFGAELIK